jgi:hypothetical protein
MAPTQVPRQLLLSHPQLQGVLRPLVCWGSSQQVAAPQQGPALLRARLVLVAVPSGKIQQWGLVVRLGPSNLVQGCLPRVSHHHNKVLHSRQHSHCYLSSSSSSSRQLL